MTGRKMTAIINVGLLIEMIRRRGWSGFSEASARCRVSPKNFQKLIRGEIPRLDALGRICAGLGITESQLVVGMSKPKPPETAQVIELKRG